MASNPDHKKQIIRVNRMIGQLEGIKRLIESGEYCPKILIQTKAISSALRSLETELLDKHINHCVKSAIKSGRNEKEKVEELVSIFKTRIK